MDKRSKIPVPASSSRLEVPVEVPRERPNSQTSPTVSGNNNLTVMSPSGTFTIVFNAAPAPVAAATPAPPVAQPAPPVAQPAVAVPPVAQPAVAAPPVAAGQLHVPVPRQQRAHSPRRFNGDGLVEPNVVLQPNQIFAYKRGNHYVIIVTIIGNDGTNKQ